MPVLQAEGKVKEFWLKWLQADEPKQLRLIESLMLPTNTIRNKKIYNFHAASIINRYMEDFVKVIASMSTAELELYLTPYEPKES